MKIHLKPFQDFINKICIRLMHPEIGRYIRFVKENYAKGKKCKIKTAFGRGWKNVVIILNKEYAFKFPFSSCDRKLTTKLATKEKRLVDAFRKVSPIYIPSVELINWNGLIVRKYEYVNGKPITDFEPSEISIENRVKIAKQLADFIWAISQYDPAELNDLKKNPNDKSDFVNGWAHDDLATNFLMDKDFNIVAVIDWEEAYFGDTKWVFWKLNRSLNKRGYHGILVTAIFDYVFDYLDTRTK